MSQFVKLALPVLAFALSSAALAETYAPTASFSGFAEARSQCGTPDTELKLPAGQSTGYAIYAEAPGPWLFVVVCQRIGFDGKPSYGPAWTSESFAEARKLCTTPSDAANMAGGESVGQAVLIHTGGRPAYLAVCQRP